MGWVVRREFRSGEAADEAGFVAEGCGGVVIGMTALPVREDDDAGAEAAEDGGDLEAIVEGVLDVAVGEVEGFAVATLRMRAAALASASRSAAVPRVPDFALGEIEDAGAPAAGLHDEEGAAAGLFDVVAMGGDGQDIDCRDIDDWDAVSDVEMGSGIVARCLVVAVGDCVHVGDVEGGALNGDVDVVDLGAVGSVEGMDLATVGGVDLMKFWTQQRPVRLP